MDQLVKLKKKKSGFGLSPGRKMRIFLTVFAKFGKLRKKLNPYFGKTGIVIGKKFLKGFNHIDLPVKPTKKIVIGWRRIAVAVLLLFFTALGYYSGQIQYQRPVFFTEILFTTKLLYRLEKNPN